MSIQQITELSSKDPDLIREGFQSGRPFIVRQLHSEWILVKKGKESETELKKYLHECSIKRDFVYAIGEPEQNGKIFYNKDMGVNFVERKAALKTVLGYFDEIREAEEDVALYLSSLEIHKYFENLLTETPSYLNEDQYRAGLWIGNKIQVPLHNDFPNNVACVIGGRRKFTLIPPNQFENLYVGPIDFTPAGRAVSMVDLQNPDLDKYPKFAVALEHVLTAELSPGDIIYIPSMWWHAVEGLDDFNVMLNFWWRENLTFLGGPDAAMKLAIATIRDLPHPEKQHWKQLFEYYIFDNSEENTAHIPEKSRGVLSRINSDLARKIKSYLLEVLS
ncbi:MAG: cupin-like domain-containing protein [Candidatus Micropelagos thuwalensis]